MVPSPLARNPFGGFVLFLAAERNKFIIIGQLQVLKQRSLHFFRNVLLSEVKQGRPGLLVQFTGFFFLIHLGIPSTFVFWPSEFLEALLNPLTKLYFPPYTQTTRVKILRRNIKL